MAPPPATEEDRAMQRYLTDYFHHWRLGLANRYDRWERRNAIAQMAFPRRHKWLGYEGMGTRPKAMHMPRPIQVWNAAGPEVTKTHAHQTAHQLAKRTNVAGLKFVKVLGWGGLGVAGLFEAVGMDGKKYKVVCKMDLFEKYPCVAGEIQMHLRTAGAKHVIQRLVLQSDRKRRRFSKSSQRRASRRLSIAETESSRANRGDDDFFEINKDKVMRDVQDDFLEVDRDEVMKDVDEAELVEVDKKEVLEFMKVETARELDADPRVLFIEYMPRGRFEDYIGKVSASKGRFPDKVLWHIFDCMFRAVIGMAYPDAFQPVGSNPMLENLPQISESAAGFPPLTSHCKRETMIHFDLDAMNVLVGDFDENEHNIVPIIKIADLGLAKIMDASYRQSTTDMWNVRRCGKVHIMTPEQFIEEWDHVDTTPQAAGCVTAGNYNWWTNLYQISLIMWSLITLCETEYPPAVERHYLTHPDGAFTQEWTFGGHLLNARFDETDRVLRELVALCMTADPTRRPTMHALEAALRERVSGGGPVDGDEDYAQRWAQKAFGGPAPPEPGIGLKRGEGEGEGGMLRGPGPSLPPGEAAKWRKKAGLLAAEAEEGAMRMNLLAGLRKMPNLNKATAIVGKVSKMPGFVKNLFG